MEKFKNKYRIESVRASWWDYSRDGVYFITICTAARAHYFGAVKEGKMQLSRIGVIADILWHELKNHFPSLHLGAFVVMPNHLHGVLHIEPDIEADDLPAEALTMSSISPKAQSLPTAIRSYKSAVSRHARRLGYEFAWQSRYYDIIIRNQKSYDNITNYIDNNPLNWEKDKFYKKT